MQTGLSGLLKKRGMEETALFQKEGERRVSSATVFRQGGLGAQRGEPLGGRFGAYVLATS